MACHLQRHDQAYIGHNLSLYIETQKCSLSSFHCLSLHIWILKLWIGIHNVWLLPQNNARRALYWHVYGRLKTRGAIWTTNTQIPGSPDPPYCIFPDFGIPGSRDPRIQETMDLRIPWSPDFWIPGSPDPRISGSQDLRIPGSPDPRISWSQNLRISRSLDPWIFWYPDRQISGSLNIWISDPCNSRSPGLQKPVPGSVDPRSKVVPSIALPSRDYFGLFWKANAGLKSGKNCKKLKDFQKILKRSQNILKTFAKHSQNILKTFSKHSQNIHKDSQKILKTFSKVSQRILKGFSKDSQRILKGFSKDYQKIIKFTFSGSFTTKYKIFEIK